MTSRRASSASRSAGRPCLGRAASRGSRTSRRRGPARRSRGCPPRGSRAASAALSVHSGTAASHSVASRPRCRSWPRRSARTALGHLVGELGARGGHDRPASRPSRSRRGCRRPCRRVKKIPADLREPEQLCLVVDGVPHDPAQQVRASRDRRRAWARRRGSVPAGSAATTGRRGCLPGRRRRSLNRPSGRNVAHASAVLRRRLAVASAPVSAPVSTTGTG